MVGNYPFILICLCVQGIVCQVSVDGDVWPVREFRAAWVATVANIDWPLSSHGSTAQQQAGLDDIVDTAHRLNFNALVFQVRSIGDAMYNSSLEPWSVYLTGTQGKAPSPFYDPLEYLVRKAHMKGIEVHAWFNPYRARSGSSSLAGLAPSNMAVRFPQYAYAYGHNVWVDPGAAIVQDHIVAVFSDVVTRYDIDGVHMDDYFYPYPISGHDFPDAHTYNSYRSHGGTLSKSDWRKNNVDTLVQRINNVCHKIKPHMKVGIAPFGIWKSGHPSGIRGLSSVDALYADARKWLQQGWVDYLAPQLYWEVNIAAQSYPALLQWWIQQNTQHRHIYVGNFASAISTKHWPVSEIIDQVEISRSHMNEFSLGNIQFSWKHFRMNTKSIADEFLAKLYTVPALTPSMPWMNVSHPLAPTDVHSQGKTVRWSPRSGDSTFYWAIYHLSADVYNLIDVVPRSTVQYDVSEDGIYAIRGVNRAGIESKEAIITVDSSGGVHIIG